MEGKLGVGFNSSASASASASVSASHFLKKKKRWSGLKRACLQRVPT